jgi:hypothetical protein
MEAPEKHRRGTPIIIAMRKTQHQMIKQTKIRENLPNFP